MSEPPASRTPASGPLLVRRGARVVPRRARVQHRGTVLGWLFHHGPMTRADLARATGLASVSVSDIVAGLVEEGIVSELGRRSTGGVGKPGTLVGLLSSEHHVVAVDLRSLSRVRLAVLGLDGVVVQEVWSDFAGLRSSAAVTALEQMCRQAIEASPRRVLGVGVAVPGIVDPDGRVLESLQLSWTDVPLAETLGRALGTPVQVVNDADALALAEYTYGSASAAGFLLLSVGVGVGAGLVLEGRLVRGHRSASGEISHLQVDPEGEVCHCGRRGCLSTVLSQPHLEASVAGQDAEGRRERLRRAGQLLAGVLAPTVAAVDLEQVLLAGPPELLAGDLVEAVAEAVAERCPPVGGRAVEVRLAELGTSGALQGATARVIEAVLGFS
ncbi:ROK family transcriptional regulator [Desertihabitans aurantiacus]|uniref:ROK family transcriptional regulator n=1 Tax=Desertihabitans aurantiacus TaxID=2282477 RepID=UPI000DF749F1|nr:ROK family transcriptional regulator [Desertihabitans aurantiacus]